ncbi:MAG TPA: hypothetical protein VOA80_18570 [Thermoanaerobaculia bacterium]|nr:hypothetical protein [Thermoanaerobaculia bacterium]
MRSQRRARRRISIPWRGGAGTGAADGRGPLQRLLLGAAPLLAVLALAEAPGIGPGWAATPAPIGANGKAAATAVAGAGEHPAGSGSAEGEAAAAGQARLRRSEVPAAGRQETILSVERFGRYSVRAASRQGTAVRVIDRMAGELGAAGEAGRENGRIDLFLDRGDYQVVTESHVHGEGTAKLSVEPFRDAHDAPNASVASTARGPAAPELVERKLVTETLDDLRQLPYWLRLADRREVRLEAAGRNLADLRLWRDGSWLEDVEPSCGAIQPVTGQPLLRCEIAATLPAGLYLVTLYGGPSQPWSEDAAEHPLYLRWGYPQLADAGRRRYQVSPFGEDRFELPANVNYVRIELPQARPAWLTAGWAPSGRLLTELAAAGAATAEVKKNSVPPVAAVRVPERPSARAEEETGRRSGGATPAPAARGAEPSIADETEGQAGQAGQAGDGTPAEGGEGSAAAGGDTLSNAGAAAMPAGAPGSADAGSAANDAGADETAQETAPGAAMPEPSGATEAALPAPAGGGEEMAGAAADETSAGAPQAVQPPAEEAPAAGAGDGETAETAETGSEAAGNEANGAQGQAASATAAPGHGGPRLWVSVRGTPGQLYVLQHFEQKDVYTFRTDGRYWVSTVHSGDPRDSVDATAILTSRPVDGSERERPEKAAAVPIDSQHAWARRFNLLGRLELFLEVGEQGTYEVVAAGGGRFRIEPFLTSRPADYKEPDFKRSGSRWELDRGLYVLTAEPLRRGGIVTMGVRPAGKFADLVRQAAAPGAERDPVRASARFVELPLQSDRQYTLHVNRQPGVEAGVVLRPWPVDLGQPLPVTQRPGEVLALNFTAAAAGTLRAEAEDGQLLEAMVDGGPWQTAVAVTAGGHLAQIRQPATLPGAPGAGTVSYSLWVEPQELAAAAPLPPLPAAALAALPKFPELRPGSPRFIDLARGAGATYVVKVDRPALYQLQTTGVLATRAALRTRTVTSLAAGSANGVGRNALVRQYLREGDFQATVTAEGRSQGHLGVELRTTQLIDGGELRPDAPARITMPAGQGVVYRFTIVQPGEYRLLAMGLGFVYGCRLEDAGGWPIAPPNIPADLSRQLAPGAYRLVLLPQPIAGRAVTLLSRRREAPHFAGHGPHPLPLGTTVTHLWREPEGVASQQEEQPAQRPPDLWRFDLPAAATATITLDAEMQGTLTRLDADGGGAGTEKAEAGAAPAELGQVPPGRALSLELAAGHYQLAVVCSRRNSLVRYRVRVATAELVDGQEPLLTAPVTLKVSVGGAGLVEISSYSAADVRARLYTADGRLVADEDDRPDDWNFLISERLPAGRYRLEIEPVGRRSAKLRLSMRTAAEVEDRPLALPYRGDVELAGEVRLLPLVLARQADLLLVAARSQENVGLGLEVREGAGWRLLGSRTGREPRLELPLPAPAREERAANAGAGTPSMPPAARYRVRLWSLERRGAPVRLAAAAVTAPRIREGQLAKGAILPLVPAVEPPLAPLAAAVIELRQPGLVRLQLAGRTERPGETRRTTPADGPIPPASPASVASVAPAKRSHAGRHRGDDDDDAEGGGADAGAPDGGDTGDHREGWRASSVAGQVLAPLSSVERVTLGALRQSGGTIWLVAEAPHGAPRLRGERLALASGLDRAVRFHLPEPAAPLQLPLPPAPPSQPSPPLSSVLPAPAELPALPEMPALAETISCDLDRGRGQAGGPVLAMVTALAGQPAVQVVDAAATGAPSAGRAGRAGRAGIAGAAGALAGAGAGAAAMLAIGPRSAVSVALSPRQPSAEVWDADPGPSGAAAAPEVRLAQLSFSPPRPETATWGVTGGSVSGLEARQFELPPGAKKIRLSLGPALVAVLSDGDTATSTHWQGGLPFEELLDGGATRLTLLHTASGSDPFTFELLPRAAGEEELVLPSATPFVRSFDRAGTLRLRLSPLPAGTAAAASPGRERRDQREEPQRRERRYRVWSASLDDAGELGRSPAAAPGAENGASRGSTAVNPDAADAANGTNASHAADVALIDGAGHVRRGAELAGAPGGYLLIRHGPGVVAAWVAGLLEPGPERTAGEKGWQAPLAAPATAVTPPATVPLAGRFVHLTLAAREPAVLHLRAAAPALTLLAGTGGETVAIHPAGVRLDAYLLPGVTHLGFSALGEGELGGFAELTTTPVTPTGEGLGPEVLLPPGDTRWFSFHVAARRRVGWGAAAGAERVSCRLLQADGRAVTPGSPGGQGAAGTSRTTGSARPQVLAGPGAPVPPAPPVPSAVTARADMLQMAELEAGDYLLVLTAPPDSAPLRVRPVVVGLDLPDTGPPPEVIRHYLQEAGAIPAADPGSHP